MPAAFSAAPEAAVLPKYFIGEPWIRGMVAGDAVWGRVGTGHGIPFLAEAYRSNGAVLDPVSGGAG